MAAFLINTILHSMLAIATIVALVAVFGTTKKDVDSLGSTYADAVIFSNWSKEAIAIVQRKQQNHFA